MPDDASASLGLGRAEEHFSGRPLDARPAAQHSPCDLQGWWN